MANDFKRTLENCRIVAFDRYVKADGKMSYSLGIVQGREYCAMMSCEENIGKDFNGDVMFDKLCRVIVRTISTQKGDWTVVTGVDFIKVQEK